MTQSEVTPLFLLVITDTMTRPSTGMAGGEGAFIMVTFWLVEAMARVGILLTGQILHN